MKIYCIEQIIVKGGCEINKGTVTVVVNNPIIALEER